MQYPIRLGAALLAIAGLLALSAFLIPARHEAGMSIRVQAAPEAVWAVLSAVEEYPKWRTGVAASEIIRTRPALAWRQTDSGGRVSLHTEGPGRAAEKWVDRITGGDAAMKGTRTVLIVADAAGGSTIGLTHAMEIRNPLARFHARFITGHTRSLKSYLDDLKGRLGE